MILIKPQVFEDERGFFMETYHKDKYEKHGIPREFFQDNLSKSQKGTLRGLHYQKPPFTQGKLVQVIEGAILDVAVDIRHGSPTFGQHVAVELNDKNKHQLWVPPGFAHGFVALSDSVIFNYKCTAPYSPEHDRGIAWDDPRLGINWGVENPIVSDKDKKHRKFEDIDRDFIYADMQIANAARDIRQIVKKVLVTGGAGFIGANFIHYMLKKYPDYEITNLDALTYAGNLENLKSVENNPRYKFVKGDITDRELVNELVKETDMVVHFAAESHVDRSILDARSFIYTNVLGTHNLLEAAKNNGNKRFHHVSTDEVFGSLGPDDAPFNENTSHDPRSPYSASKASSDNLVRAYYHTYGLPITISNCSNNYGPYQFPEKLIPLFVTNLLEGKKVPIYGDGLNVRDWLHVEDHCAAIDLIIHSGKIGETYCVGGDAEKTNIEIAKKIIRCLNQASGKDGFGNKGSKLTVSLEGGPQGHEIVAHGIKSVTVEKGENGDTCIRISRLPLGEIGFDDKIEYVKDRSGHDRRYAIDFSKIKNELGWKPKITFEEGLKSTVEWYKENENWWRNIKSGSYKDYYQKTI